MTDHRHDFVELALRQDVLRFGDFTLKSGRRSPYFFNSGQFSTGVGLAGLGRSYADAIVDAGIEFDVLLGPAYKGIPIAAATAVQLAERHGRDVPWAYNRKEAKAHGEGGVLVGAPLRGRVLLIDDVITSGKAIREVLPLIDGADAELAAIIVAIDRQERGTGELSAIGEVERDTGTTVHSIVRLDDVIEYLEVDGRHADHLAAMREYRAQHGV